MNRKQRRAVQARARRKRATDHGSERGTESQLLDLMRRARALALRR